MVLTVLKEHIDRSIVVMEDFNIALLALGISTRQNNSKELRPLSEELEGLRLSDLYRVFHPRKAKYTFFSAHGTFFRKEHILGYSEDARKSQKHIFIKYPPTDHNSVKLEINHKKKM